ncbi:hypothetical protein ACJRO7_023572 [Eucalyptus globulus]|uniref:Uncharacterized protein n=1 Tax=Eucalyptus globulus TaxID=34317 RepID=A0ABD3K2W0_EUCGL
MMSYNSEIGVSRDLKDALQLIVTDVSRDIKTMLYTSHVDDLSTRIGRIPAEPAAGFFIVTALTITFLITVKAELSECLSKSWQKSNLSNSDWGHGALSVSESEVKTEAPSHVL